MIILQNLVGKSSTNLQVLKVNVNQEMNLGLSHVYLAWEICENRDAVSNQRWSFLSACFERPKFLILWAERLSYSNSFDNKINICLEPEA